MEKEAMSEFKKPNAIFGARHFQSLLLFLGMIFINLMKVDMSIGIVAMTDGTRNNTFDWSHKTQSVILSSYKWGYLVSKIPGGLLSAHFGGKIVLLACAVINCIGSLLMPTSAYYGDWKAVCAVRLSQGLAQGLLVPTTHTLKGKWLPPQERATLSSIISSGSYLGNVIEYMLAGIVASYWGWPAIFYMNGCILSFWILLYLFLGSSSPRELKRISSEERLYIQSSLGQMERQKLKTPWKALLTSIPFLALILTQTGAGWGHWTLLTELPTYLKKVYGVNIKTNGFMSALPYLACFITCYIYGPVADYTIRRGWISIGASRKINNSISFFGQAISLSMLTYVANDVVTAVIIFMVCEALDSAHYAGFYLTYLDMSPNHAGTMIGIAGFVSNVCSTFAPLAAGWLVLDETSPEEWRKVFLFAAALLTFSNIVFLIFSTSRLQKWNNFGAETKETTITEAKRKTKS